MPLASHLARPDRLAPMPHQRDAVAIGGLDRRGAVNNDRFPGLDDQRPRAMAV